MAVSVQGASPAASEPEPGPYRVMVVDDSVVVRGLITRALEADPDIRVVASVANGQQAVTAVGRNPIEVVVLDIEMPVMDGITALPLLFAADSALKVIMASTLTKRNAEISLRALSAGAADYVTKPSATRDLTSAGDFQRDLIEKVKVLGAARRKGVQRRSMRSAVRARTGADVPVRAATPAPIAIRRPGLLRPDVVAIASSTGGPQALMALLGELGAAFVLPVLVTQHMPPSFTAILAEHLSRHGGRPCHEAVDGEAIRPGRTYVAPGDFHMLVEAHGKERVIRLDSGPAENFCRPAADPMLRSVARTFGAHALAVVLTGMGQDGLNGARELAAAGGTIIAQDEASSVVWGMPGAVAHAGLCSAVLPLGEIAGYLRKTAPGGLAA